ncbi:MAG: hypothetical protein AAFY41_18180, partial [Bacteroidota bacterium]
MTGNFLGKGQADSVSMVYCRRLECDNCHLVNLFHHIYSQELWFCHIPHSLNYSQPNREYGVVSLSPSFRNTEDWDKLKATVANKRDENGKVSDEEKVSYVV